MSKRKKHDPALVTAREILAATVCECGHVAGDHAIGTATDSPCSECACKAMRPVAFAVERAALAEIHAELNGQTWSPDTLDRIAAHLRAAGYVINEPDEQ